MNYDDALKFIITKQRLGIMPGLSRIKKLLSLMGNPQNKLKIIHIAGTNGKGTISSTIAETLKNCGYKVGLFTSPWVDDYREQIAINGDYIPKEIFAKYVDEYKDAEVTEFEFLTAIMYKYFADSKVDYAVVECGMGGKGDSTNAIKTPLLSVITSVSLDHTNFFGNTLTEIATEKAGIIKENGTVVLYPNKSCEEVFEKRCLVTNSKLVKVNEFGDFKLNNFETVKKCLSLLNINCDFKLKKLPARQEYVGSDIMIDGAHNENGAVSLKEYLPKRDITAIIGMMKDKDVDAYLKNIAPCCKKIIATEPSNSRSMVAEELAEIATKYCNNVEIEKNPEKALQKALKNYDFLLICGSFFLARDIRKDLI